MKLLVDLLPCQSGSRKRGIGRYTLELTKALATTRGKHELLCMADAGFSEALEDLRRIFMDRLLIKDFQVYHHAQIPLDDLENFEKYKKVATSLIDQARKAAAPDMVITTSFFEGWGNHRVTIPMPKKQTPGYLQVMILYDLIPLIYQEHYLDPQPDIRKWYFSLLDHLKYFDLLLTISESTRQDAIQKLDIPPERAVNISGAASDYFQEIEISEAEKRSFLSGMGISRPFVFYLGGDNYRKNMVGALKAYAELPQDLIRSHQLVVNDPGQKGDYRKKAYKWGLEDDDLIILDRVSDEELLRLYNLCKVFFFPSLYEGFGLPVLEAMACGAPTITSDTSSLTEIMDIPDALFDVDRTESITSVLKKALTKDRFREELSLYGKRRSEEFSWERSANRVWKALDGLYHENRNRDVFPAVKIQDKRQRIAYLSPLPPQKSGISHYSVELLPHLGEFFDIDLYVDQPDIFKGESQLENFNIYSADELLTRKDKYQTAVYQHGNSQYHAYMMERRRKFPGVTVLHDFYLSHLVRHALGPSEKFMMMLEQSHGLRGLIDYQIDGEKAVWEWPINWDVLRYSNEIIVHSDYPKSIVEGYYGNGWIPKINVIPQLYAGNDDAFTKESSTLRQKMGLKEDDFIFCTFGHINETKEIEKIVQAFIKTKDKIDKNSYLIIVGRFVGDKLKRKVSDLIRINKLDEAIVLTGYVSDKTYHAYLRLADVAIQLRRNTRGETSRTILDCLSTGIPVIVNAYGSNNDFPDSCVEKVSHPVKSQDLSRALIRLANDVSYRKSLSQNARKHISEVHDPQKAALEYAHVIENSIRKDDRVLFREANDALADLGFPDHLINSQASYASKNLLIRSQGRILIDISKVNNSDLGTGIQRVVKQILTEWLTASKISVQIEPVYLSDGKLFRAARFTERLIGLEEGSLGKEKQIIIKPNDFLFIMDSIWEDFAGYQDLYTEIRQSGGKISALVYDLIPIQFPQYCFTNVPKVYKKWLDSMLVECDEIICISETIAKGVSDYRLENRIRLEESLDIRFFHLGADFKPEIGEENSGNGQIDINLYDRPIFIMVGTLEPRKGHEFVLRAFEKLWSQGNDLVLIFAGKIGWGMDEFESQIRDHPRLNETLLFIENPTDGELLELYDNATALIAASEVEGFGLPIVEAAAQNLPVIASDIPVFREVAGEGALFYSLDSGNELIDAVTNLMEMKDSKRQQVANRIDYITWSDSAHQLLNMILNRENRYN